jgi:transcriptional regulator with XRE-family HTH domain
MELNNNRIRIGQRLAQLRQEKGMTTRQLAEVAGLHQSNITKIENGKYSVGLDVLSKICTALDAEITIQSL